MFVNSQTIDQHRLPPGETPRHKAEPGIFLSFHDALQRPVEPLRGRSQKPPRMCSGRSECLTSLTPLSPFRFKYVSLGCFNGFPDKNLLTAFYSFNPWLNCAEAESTPCWWESCGSMIEPSGLGHWWGDITRSETYHRCIDTAYEVKFVHLQNNRDLACFSASMSQIWSEIWRQP